MTMVVTQPCIGCKDKSCVSVCPTESFHEDSEMLYINPESCIDCEACVVECPVEAIYHQDDVPDRWRLFIDLNEQKVKSCEAILT